MKNLIWIASYPKSGNTWVRSILYAALTGKLDINEIGKVVPGFNAYSIVNPEGGGLPNIEEHAKFWDEAQEKASIVAGNKFQFFKTHSAACEINSTIFPNQNFTAKAIYIIRDPRDVALSYARHFDADIEKTIEIMLDVRNYIGGEMGAEALSSWKNHVISWSSVEFPVLFVRYEDLLTDINRQLVRIFGFLGIRPKIKRSELIATTKFSYLQAQERSDGFRESVNDQPFFRRGISGEGKIFIGTNFKEMEKEFSDVMSSFDYT